MNDISAKSEIGTDRTTGVNDVANLRAEPKKYAIVALIDSKEEMVKFILSTSFPEEDKDNVQFIILDRSFEAEGLFDSDEKMPDAQIQTEKGTHLSDGESEEAARDAAEEAESIAGSDAESFEMAEKMDEDTEMESSREEAAESEDFEIDEEAESLDKYVNTLDLSNYSIKNTAIINKFEYYKINPECSAAQAYNDSFDKINAQFVCYTNGNIFYEKFAVRAIDAALEKFPNQKIAALNIKHFIMNEPEECFDTVKISLDTFKKLNLFPFAYFYSVDLIGRTRFKETLEEEVCVIFLLEMLKKVENIAFVRSVYAQYSEEVSAEPARYYGCREKQFYIDSVEKNYLPLLEEYKDSETGVPIWLQRAIINLLYFKVNSNYQARDKFILIGDEIDRFFDACGKALKYVDDSILMGVEGYKQYKIPLSILNMFMYLKYDRNESKLGREFYIKDDKLFLKQAGQEYHMKSAQKITIQAINVEKNDICFDAFFPYEMLYTYAPDAIYVMLNNERIDVEHLDIYAYDKAFGISINKKYTFQFRIDKKRFLKNNTTLSFRLELHGNSLVLPMTFNKAASRLNGNYRCSYWYLNDNYYIKYTRPYITVFKGGKKQRYKNELALLFEIQQKAEDRAWCKDIIKLRTRCFFKKKKMRKRRIWLYFDKLYKGGDNGEYQFRHDFAKAKEDGVECYYIVNEDAACYPQLKKEFGKYILEYGTYRCRLYALAAETIVATGPEIIEFVGFNKGDKDLFRDLFDANLVCIAHGVTIQKNANVQNRLFDNTEFYTTSSKYEVAHIKQPVYGYNDDQIALTGMARFDGLKNNDQKQILITPTWRINLVTARKARNAERGYFSQFKQSDYFKIYNGLINDPRLIEAAKKHGYRIVFLLHPLMSSQINDYDRNDYVELKQATGDMSYEKILTESSLMVTDYSGIHYDFGYMRKPIIYYQPKEVPARFEEGGMIFSTMGFGPLTFDYEEAVDLMCAYMENGCVLEEKYRKRADDFFAFDDFNNCGRIHDAIHKWVKEKK